MAVNPLIQLQSKTPTADKFGNALMNIQQIEQTSALRERLPIETRALEAQTASAEAAVPSQEQQVSEEERIHSASVAEISRVIIPSLKSGNIEAVVQQLQERLERKRAAGVNTKNTEAAIELAQTNAPELLRRSEIAVDVDNQLRGVTGPKPVFKEGLDPSGEAGLFTVTPEGASRVPGITPAPRTPLVQIGAGGKQAEQKELAKLRAQDLKGLRAKGSEAEQQLNSLNILDNIDVSTGTAEPMKQAIAAFADGFGIDSSGLANIAAGQAFTSEAGRVVLRVMSTQKGPQTDKDQARIARTLTRLGNKPEANVFINDSARAVANRALDQRDFHDAWLDKNDTLKGAASAWNKLKRDSPMVSQFVQNDAGLPVFYFRFKERVLEANAGATNEQILNAWRRQEKTAKAGRK